MQYNINRRAAKILALSCGKIDKYEYLTGEEILPSDQRQIIEQAKFACSPLREASEKRKEKQVGVIKSLGPSGKLKRIEGMSLWNVINDLICARLKEIAELQDIIQKTI